MAPHSGYMLGTQLLYGQDSGGYYRRLKVDTNGSLLVSFTTLEFTEQVTLPASGPTLSVSSDGVLWFTSTDNTQVQIWP